MRLPRVRSARFLGGGWLSLFAMWMIFIGPLVSQSMPMNHHASTPLQMPPASGHQHADASHAGHGEGGHAHALWEACGYCTLLFNCPALPQTLSPLSAISALAPSLAAPPAHQGHARQAVFPGARSRAPPASISV